MNTSEDYLNFLVLVIEEAGSLAMKHFRQTLDVDDKNSGAGVFDPVTQADKEVEEFIRAKISAAHPEHNIIGEEFAAKKTAASETWLIDPIDGTRGFVSGSPMWGTLIGLMNGQECVVGGMRQAFTKETWVGDTQRSYFIHDGVKSESKVRQRDSLCDAIICCTHPSMYPDEESLMSFQRVLKACQFSRFGTECLGYGMLANGYVDMVVEGGLSAYDIMPLIPIVQGAGGIVTNWEGGSAAAGGFVVAAANERLHEQAMNLLNA